MGNAPRFVIVSLLTGVVLVATSETATSQQPRGVVSVSAGYAANIDELRHWDATIDGMERTGELVVMSRVEDRRLPERTHEYLAQYVGGVPVYGGGVSRQLDRRVTVSLLGTIHEGIDLGAAPALSADEVAARIEQATGATLVGGRSPSLGILPLPDGSHALAYRAPMSDGRFYFADAADGGLVHAEDAFHSQSAIGTGVGFLGDRKKMAATIAGGRFEARDQLRSGEIVTLDMRGDLERRELLVFDAEPWTSNDIASDDDNEWHVQAVIDGHAHMGWTYDYLTQRHGWNGLDGDNGRIIGLVNNDFNNALAIRPPFGPEETGAYVFGMRGTEPRVALHTVAHELMHGVTFFAVSQRTGSEFFLGTDFSVGARLGPESFVDQ